MFHLTVVRAVLFTCAVLVLGLTEVSAAPGPCTPVPGDSIALVQYTSFGVTSFGAETFSLYPCYGKHIVLLTRSPTLSVNTRQELVAALDAAYQAYVAITGQEPIPYGPTVRNGRATIAEIPDGHTCGAGCGYLGFTGIEISSTSFHLFVTGYVQHRQYDHALFYEFGRNFWRYHEQLAVLDPFVTGFAIANRFISMEVAALPGGPFNNQLPFDLFKQSILIDLLDHYLADRSLNWENTLNVGRVSLTPARNPYGWGAADLAGAMFYRIFRDHGLSGYRAFYTALATLPPAYVPTDAVHNFIRAAALATGQDYTSLFITLEWFVPTIVIDGVLDTVPQ